jgi:hypothetical protein
VGQLTKPVDARAAQKLPFRAMTLRLHLALNVDLLAAVVGDVDLQLRRIAALQAKALAWPSF